ncbi:MAG: nuclear transport factor 2 family protein [Chloroflexota bacterium]
MSTLADWMGAYLRAWETNDPEEVGALFSDEALYLTEPSAEPWHGRPEIVEGWLGRKDEPGDATFEWAPLVDSDRLGVITGRTTYLSGDDYDNLWVIRFDDDGRCSEFTEWWMRRAT